MGVGRRGWMVALAALAAGCAREARYLGPDAPLTAPAPADPRVALFQGNVDQIGQGGRYFGWYGCTGCHGPGATGVLDLGDRAWRHGGAFDQVYRAIAAGHGALDYGGRVPVQQLWQLTAYVRDLPGQPAEKRARQARDQAAEPTGAAWSGAVR